MGEKKVTRMLLKVDLQCCKCYKKVKKVLCQFPHVRDQVFDEKANTVTIKVVCCSPEKIKDKIRYKGGASIKSIEIILDKPKEPEKQKQPEKPKEPKKPKQPEPKQLEEEPKKPKQPEPKQLKEESENPKGTKDKEPKKLKEPEKPPVQPIVLPGPTSGYPWTCCTECYQGRGGGPCNQMCYGQPMRYYDGYCGRPVYDSWGSGGGYRPCYGNRNCGECFSDENPLACSII